MHEKSPPPAAVIVKRPTQERKRLPPELEAFARSGKTRLRVHRPAADRGKVDDPREGYAIAGVANRDARAVYDARVAEMVSLWNGGDPDGAARPRLEECLLDALRLELWRARRVTGFSALAEQVIGIPVAEAEAMTAAAATRLGEPLTPVTERHAALWLRAEAGLYEGDPAARAVLREATGQAVLSLSIQASLASLGLAGVGAKHAPLARAQREREGRPLPRPFEGEPGELGTGEMDAGRVEMAPAPDGVAGARLLRRRAQEDGERACWDEVDPESAPTPERSAHGAERTGREAVGRSFDDDRARPRVDGEKPWRKQREGAWGQDRPSWRGAAGQGARGLGSGEQGRGGYGQAGQGRGGYGQAGQGRGGYGQAGQGRGGYGQAGQGRGGYGQAGQGRGGYGQAGQGRGGDRPAFGEGRDRPRFDKRGASGGRAALEPKFGAARGEGRQGFGKFKSGSPSQGKGGHAGREPGRGGPRVGAGAFAPGRTGGGKPAGWGTGSGKAKPFGKKSFGERKPFGGSDRGQQVGARPGKKAGRSESGRSGD